MEKYSISREIAIDAGHRVPKHASKCRNLHGHRYVIIATCEGVLIDDGEEEGMVQDFGFLKQDMLDVIDQHCDHGMIISIEDRLLPALYGDKIDLKLIKSDLAAKGFHSANAEIGKIYVLPYVPTAENLARHWYETLSTKVNNTHRKIKKIEVWETPNCKATFPV